MSRRLTHERPWFENSMATIMLEGQQATLTFEEAVSSYNSEEPGLKIYEYRLA